MENQKASTITELLESTKGTLVQLPDFAPGIPFVAILRRPSMMNLVKSGKIPNTLLNSANQLFSGSNPVAVKSQEDEMSKLVDLLDVVCEASFVEPKFKEMKEAGVELTDEQYMFVFNWTQQGVKALDSFR